MKIWAKLDSPHFVQYKSAWNEQCDERTLHQYKTKVKVPDDLVINSNCFVLYFQMDLCWFDLNFALNECRKYFNVGDKQLFPRLGYYILSELLLEIVECIGFLHESNPKIIHRDIKPANFLIKAHGRDGRFVKLADFGLAVTHETDSQSHTTNAGTRRYMAPEVSNGRKYKWRADLYSLGVMIQEMFNIDINK